MRQWLWACAALMAAALPMRGAVPEASARAVLVFQLTKFVTWTQTGPGDVFRIGILGPDPLGGVLDEVVAGESVGGRLIQVRRAATAADLVDCQLVYVSPHARETAASALATLGGRGVLTVGENDGFLEAGGMVALALTPERKVRLRINLESVRGAGLAVSAQLLRVADIVRGPRP